MGSHNRPPTSFYLRLLHIHQHCSYHHAVLVRVTGLVVQLIPLRGPLKLVPVIMTGVPPVVGPRPWETLVMVGGGT